MCRPCISSKFLTDNLIVRVRHQTYSSQFRDKLAFENIHTDAFINHYARQKLVVRRWDSERMRFLLIGRAGDLGLIPTQHFKD